MLILLTGQIDLLRIGLTRQGEVIVAHVKNTGRGKEVFFPGVEVVLDYVPSDKKTDYDLIAVRRKENCFNIGSQLPNELAIKGILNDTICLPGLLGGISLYKREVTFLHSKFDIYLETTSGQKIFVEVKGMTLGNDSIGAFPDAPTLRGLKYVEELIKAKKQGYHAYVFLLLNLNTSIWR